MTPSALAGPGVSRPTARTDVLAVPVCSRMWSSACTSASTATSGPSCTELGVSTSRSTRNFPEASRTVALLLVPPLSRPTTTHESGLPIVASRPRNRLAAHSALGRSVSVSWRSSARRGRSATQARKTAPPARMTRPAQRLMLIPAALALASSEANRPMMVRITPYRASRPPITMRRSNRLAIPVARSRASASSPAAICSRAWRSESELAMVRLLEHEDQIQQGGQKERDPAEQRRAAPPDPFGRVLLGGSVPGLGQAPDQPAQLVVGLGLGSQADRDRDDHVDHEGSQRPPEVGGQRRAEIQRAAGVQEVDGDGGEGARQQAPEAAHEVAR